MRKVEVQPGSWQCGVCAAENVETPREAPFHCWACGRARPSVDWSRRLWRIGAIVFGVALQFAAGVLIWVYPPGASVWSWALYLLMGIAGFAHIFIGGEMLRPQALRDDAIPEPVFNAATLPHSTGEPMTLAPGEMRTSGAAIVAVVVVLATASLVVMWVLGGP